MSASYEVFFYPGRDLSERKLGNLVTELKELEPSSADSILNGNRSHLARAIILVARNQDQKITGFSSALVLPVTPVGNILHLGLTSAIDEKTSNFLIGKLIFKYLLKEPLFSHRWISYCSGLPTNFSPYAEDIYPSLNVETPSITHLVIANGLSKYFKSQIGINIEAKLNIDNFKFEEKIQLHIGRVSFFTWPSKIMNGLKLTNKRLPKLLGR